MQLSRIESPFDLVYVRHLTQYEATKLNGEDGYWVLQAFRRAMMEEKLHAGYVRQETKLRYYEAEKIYTQVLMCRNEGVKLTISLFNNK